MLFMKRLREPIKRGEISCSVRIWQSPRVRVGKRYRLEEGSIVIERILPLTFEDITAALAKRSGFKGVAELVKVAKHGRGESVYLVEFRYEPMPVESLPVESGADDSVPDESVPGGVRAARRRTRRSPSSTRLL